VDDSCRWRGVVIAEGLHDPTVINDLRVTRAFITGEGQPLDEDGTGGRWRLYWVDVSDEEIDRIQAGTRHAWYAHFWRDDRLLVVYDEPGSACTVTTSRLGSLPSITGFSKVFAASGWISRATTPRARWPEGWVLAAGATRGP
jgi:hypothetical protein